MHRQVLCSNLDVVEDAALGEKSPVGIRTPFFTVSPAPSTDKVQGARERSSRMPKPANKIGVWGREAHSFHTVFYTHQTFMKIPAKHCTSILPTRKDTSPP